MKGFLFALDFLLSTCLFAQELPVWSEPEPVMYYNDATDSIEQVGGDEIFISADNQHLFIRWGNRGDTTYSHCSDIYVLHRRPDGIWDTPVNLGRNINLVYHDGATEGFALSPDLREIYWSFHSIWGWKCFRAFREDTSCDTCWSEPEIFEPIPELRYFVGDIEMSRNGLRLYFSEGYYLQRDCVGCEWDSVRYDGCYGDECDGFFPCFPSGLTNGSFTLSSSETEFYMDGGSMLHGHIWYLNCELDTAYYMYPLDSEGDELQGISLSADGQDIYIFRCEQGLFVSHLLNGIYQVDSVDSSAKILFTGDKLLIEGIDSPARLSIYDIAGRKVSSCRLFARYTEFDLSSLSAGTYFVVVYSNYRKTIKKIIVLK